MARKSEVRWNTVDTKWGKWTLAESDDKLVAVGLPGRQEEALESAGATKADKGSSKLLQRAEKQLREYLDGERKNFDLPLDVRGTAFQRKVWQALTGIPYGETHSYGQVAKKVGKPQAARAVGGACNRNHLPVVIPCHRVVGSDQSLVGFGGGLSLKKRLLALETQA